jgi:hypothetical protein
MLRIIVGTTAALALAGSAEARGHGGGSRTYYGGGHHTESHGGHYTGGFGSAHRGGQYVSPTGSRNYGRHK